MLDIVRREDEEVKDEISSFHTENPPAKCMPTFTGLVFKTYNNIKRDMTSTDTNTVTSLPISKSDTHILNITQKQHQYHHKSDMDINKATPDPHFIDVPNHRAIDITDIPNHTAIDITDIPNHTAIDLTDIPNHTAIDIIDIPNHTAIDITDIPNHTAIDITDIPNHTAIDIIHIPNHTAIDITDIPNHTTIDITDIPNHTAIDITDIPNHTATDITDIPNHTAIDIIHIPNHTAIDITDIPNHTAIDITDIPKHTAIDITDIPNHRAVVYTHMDTDSGKEPDREITERAAHSFDQIAAQYDDSDVDLDQLVKIKVENFKDSDINLDKLVDNNIAGEDLRTVIPLSSADSFHQLASQYDDHEANLDLDELVRINLPYCDNGNIDLDELVEINTPAISNSASSNNVKALIDQFNKSN